MCSKEIADKIIYVKWRTRVKDKDGTAFLIDVTQSAQRNGLEPGDAMVCFGKVAALMVEHAVLSGKVESKEEGAATILELFKGSMNHYLKHSPDKKAH